MAKKHLIDLDEAMEFIGLPCTELLSEDVNKLKELNKVLRYEFDSYDEAIAKYKELSKNPQIGDISIS
jgi:hypothetical protein